MVRIGLTTAFDGQRQQLELAYLEAVEAAGALPVLLPLTRSPATAQYFAQQLDGLIVPGGPAVTEGLIGDLPCDLDPPQPLRTQSDWYYLQAFLEQGKPILGICYGMQLLNAVLGGTLYADVQRQLEGVGPHSPKRGGTDHPIDIDPSSHLARLLNKTSWVVNTRHLQAVATLGEGLRISARAPDGVIEAIESSDGRLMGVQFHPECMGSEGHLLFRQFIAQAEKIS